jgi:hypothetical protein
MALVAVGLIWTRQSGGVFLGRIARLAHRLDVLGDVRSAVRKGDDMIHSAALAATDADGLPPPQREDVGSTKMSDCPVSGRSLIRAFGGAMCGRSERIIPVPLAHVGGAFVQVGESPLPMPLAFGFHPALQMERPALGLCPKAGHEKPATQQPFWTLYARSQPIGS